MHPSPPTDRCSALIETKTSLIYFGATPHTTDDFESILQWTGEYGLILDLRVDTERQKKTTTVFQYHNRMEVTDENYIHFPITDRSVPAPNKRTLFQDMLRRTLTYPRIYVHCRGGHGRSGIVVACLLILHGNTASTALSIVHEAHITRKTMTSRLRYTAKQKQYVYTFTAGMEDDGHLSHHSGIPIYFYEPTGEYGYLSNLWGTTGTTRCRELGGSTHLVIDGIQWKTVEHYFQAQKFNLCTRADGESASDFRALYTSGQELVQYIRLAATGSSVFRLGNIGHPNRNKSLESGYGAKHRLYPEPGVAEFRKRAPTINSIIEEFHGRVRIRSDWDTHRNTVMMHALRVKFDNPSLQNLLLATGDRSIHEHTMHDLHWGDGMGSCTGADMLGKLQCMLRAMYSRRNKHRIN